MLDSKNLSDKMIRCRLLAPLDDEANPQNLPLQTKVQIYDMKCDGCGFARIEVFDNKGDIKVFNNVADAINEAQIGGYKGIKDIKRTCEYPGNVIETIHGTEYPTLTEIIINTCRLWYEYKHEQCNETIEELIQVENEYVKIPERQIS